MHSFLPRVRTVSNTVVAAATLLIALGAPAVRAQVISTPVVDTALPAYPGATLPIAVQADGKLLVCGDTFLINGVTQKGIARLNADWTLDAGFAVGTGVDRSTINAIVVDADQKILVAGSFTAFSGQPASGLVRLLPSGAPDPSFTYDGPGRVLQVVPRNAGGYFIIADDSTSNIRWHGADGALVRLLPRPVDLGPYQDSAPPSSDRIQGFQVTPLTVAELADGTIVGGYFLVDSSLGYRSMYSRALYAFGPDGVQRTTWPYLRPGLGFQDVHNLGPVGLSMQLIPNTIGGFYVLCSASTMTARSRPWMNRHLADGTSDPGFTAPSFEPRSSAPLNGAIDSSGRLVVSGVHFSDPAYPTEFKTTVRLMANGSIDPQFGIPSPGQYSSDVLFGAVRHGATPDQDRIIMQVQNSLVAYKPTNRLKLGANSALPAKQAVTVGRDLTLSAIDAGSNIQWQTSSDGGYTWANLVDGSTYTGTTTPTLEIKGANTAIDSSLIRYVSVTARGTVASNATTIKVAPLLLPFPAAIAADAAGNLFVSDATLHTIQRIDAALNVETLAGANGQTGTADGLGAVARFNQPGGLCATTAGELVVSDTASGTLRRITIDGAVSTIAGSSSQRGGADGPGSQARFSAPTGVARNAAGVCYVADASNHTVRSIAADGTVATLAGTAGVSGASDGQRAAARFSYPTGVAVANDGTVYVTDTSNNLIRRLSPVGVVTTVAGVPAIAGHQDGTGTAALFNQPTGLGIDSAGNLYVADTGNSVIRKITPGGVVTTLAGLATVGGQKDGSGTEAWFNQPKALVVTGNGTVFVADTGNSAIRRISPEGAVTTLELKTGAPRIVTQPASQSVAAGGSAMLVVNATGGGTLTYQWYKDGASLSGATAASFALSSVRTSDAGSYTVVVRNDAGAITSTPATLTVQAGQVTPNPTPGGSSGGGGGGGAPSLLFLIAIGIAGLLRFRSHRPAPERRDAL